MHQSNNVLWKKDGFGSDLYIELFTGRGYLMHMNIGKVDIKEVFDYPGQPYKTSLHLKDSKDDEESTKEREEGNKLFDKKEYFGAMIKFNNAIRLAPNNSNELGLAYANRSSCFFHLKMFDECLVDIELAKKSNYPADLLYKLNDRVSKVNYLLASKQIKKNGHRPHEPVLSFNEQKDFPGVAECLTIEKNNKFGHHVVTTQDLFVGQTILVEQPYSIAHTASESKRRDRCMYCFKECSNFLPCSNCVSVLYCNEECMAKSFHKYHCDLWVPEPDKNRFRLVLETFFRINNAFPDIDVLIRTVELLLRGKPMTSLTSTEQWKFCQLFRLITNHDKKYDEQAEKLREIANHCYFAVVLFNPILKDKFKQLRHRRFLEHFMLHLCHICEHAYDMNEFFMEDEDESAVDFESNHYANGMFLFGNFINHSCVPNVLRLMVDNQLVWKVIRPIQRGEQLFRSQ